MIGAEDIELISDDSEDELNGPEIASETVDHETKQVTNFISFFLTQFQLKYHKT